MRLYSCLEEIQRSRRVGIGRNFLSSRIMHLRHVTNERHYVTKEFHQATNAHTLACTNAEHWEYRACDESLADTLTHLILCKCLFFKEFLHQSLVVLCSSLNELLM